MKNKIRIYLSHYIRGPKNVDATDEDMGKNIEAAIKLGEQLKAYFLDWHRQDGLPEIYLYVPAEHDEFVITAYKRGFISETEILAVDCDIISKCDILLAWKDPTQSRGMIVEVEHADKMGIPILNFLELDKLVLFTLKRVIKEIAHGT